MAQLRSKKKTLWIIGIIAMLAVVILLINYYNQEHIPPQETAIMKLSLSSDGHYAIATTSDRKAYLWDLRKHTKRLISSNANIFSAYFIKHTPDFLYQNLNNKVFVQSVDGRILQSFNLSYPTYGEVMTSDLKTFIASDQAWNLYKGHGSSQKLIKSAYTGNGYLGDGKLFNLYLSDNDKYLLTSGYTGSRYDRLPLSAGRSTYEAYKKGYEVGIGNYSLREGVVLWDVATGKPLRKFAGNVAKTYATISPSSDYVVSGDEDAYGYIWSITNGKRKFTLLDLNNGGQYLHNSNIYTKRVIKKPQDFLSSTHYKTLAFIISLKFIDKTHYLRFTYDIPYAILYSVNSPAPIKYLKLNTTPYPSINSYVRNETIDTSWQNHILVISDAIDPGITVYHYNPKNQTLNMVWNTNRKHT